ncbi:GNAT family N-acetyltransferase [Sulfitobacter sp. F26169L]|uniref:GNAT family N-acetyltransferase n=1 Tax=Sulfitobacter sp. F26169L TaxID=2996015 RepID=UPI00226099EF|nr:GNAT family N-acyltransferase [Sulfitobacter sp. F26169L]MCX7566093.1 GNAT family N-acetyltransferase [Sulfitobacter sp. F26169L]
MISMAKGNYAVRPVHGSADMQAVLDLRAQCFGAASGQTDRFDAVSTQVMVTLGQGGALVAAFRMSILPVAKINDSYAAQFYDLEALSTFQGTLLELGRFCIHPDHKDPDILRIAWAALTAFVDANDIKLLFGCSSFAGTKPEPYLHAFGVLKARHLAPPQWMPETKAGDVYPYAELLTDPPDLKEAAATMPPLLRTYLLMGGWVSDHAVVDHTMNTLHVFTGLEIDAIPPARKKLLRALV